MRKIMLIEDEELILQGLKNIIDWEALEMQVVHMAHNGEEGLRLFQEEPVDIIVTDINMPVMDGLAFLKEVRETDRRARCIILTGYDEFEYARKAVSLDVEDYILKPINEEKLEAVLIQSDEKLKEFDRKNASDPDEKAAWIQFVRGNLTAEEAAEYVEDLPKADGTKTIYAAIMKLNMESLKKAKVTDVLMELQQGERPVHAVYLEADTVLILFFCETEDEVLCRQFFTSLQDEIESNYGILSFISVGTPFREYGQLPDSYAKAKKLQKYHVIEGYGSCMFQEQIHNRQSEDILFDNALFRKMLLKKEKEEVLRYIEDLFINNIKKKTAVDDLYQMCIKMAMLLQDIKSEYKLQGKRNMQNLTEMIGKIFQAEDLFAIKTIFIGETVEIITCLHEEDSLYTPVVKQILSEVQKNYKEDMNLKTLSYKYHMNASYLGQIFQKEVGCSFAQYLSNTKNGIAKDLILNTNMRINDIAQAVGYQDTSYFYRKFKQCYGVSPASLREMKKY